MKVFKSYPLQHFTMDVKTGRQSRKWCMCTRLKDRHRHVGPSDKLHVLWHYYHACAEYFVRLLDIFKGINLDSNIHSSTSQIQNLLKCRLRFPWGRYHIFQMLVSTHTGGSKDRTITFRGELSSVRQKDFGFSIFGRLVKTSNCEHSDAVT